MKPNVGMSYPVAAKISSYTPGSGIEYEDGIVVAEARGASVNWEREDGSFYGDNIKLDSENGVLGYTLDFEPTGLKSAVRAYLLGETVAEEVYKVTSADAPDVGFGYIRDMKEDDENGKAKHTYEGWWYHKLKFAIGSEETRTKERQTEWRTPTLNGTGAGVRLDDSEVLEFAEHKDFATEAAARAWLRGKAKIQTAAQGE